MRIGIVAGEASGDQIAADLIQALHKLNPHIIFEGIAGPQMISVGCKALFPMERLSVMGIIEVLKHLPEILTIRRAITTYFLANPPDIFIGVDAPDFNLALEKKLKSYGIPTVHYVSPSVWAWRRGRIKTIEKAADVLLSILPFEKSFYQQYSKLRVEFVGHPLADQISLDNQNRDPSKTIAILPGSRNNEIHYLGELFLRTALWCAERNPNLSFIAPMINVNRREQFIALQKKIAPNLNIQIVDGNARQIMAEADAVLLASGTATLEAMLVKCPMVVAYRMSPVTHWLAQCLIKTEFISLPNLLANKMLVPEFIQEKATVENLGGMLLEYINNPELVENLKTEFTNLHQQMRCNGSERAAEIVLELINK